MAMDWAKAARQIEEIAASARASGIKPTIPFARLVGIVIATLRDNNDVSQTTLSERTGISQSTISRIENGETALDVVQARRIAEILKISSSYIFEIAAELEKFFVSKDMKIIAETVSRKEINKISNMDIVIGSIAVTSIFGISLFDSLKAISASGTEENIKYKSDDEAD